VKVCTPVEVAVDTVIVRPVPDDVANVCEAIVLPLRLVRPPPAPASDPHENDPFDQRSLSLALAQEVSPAPKSAVAKRFAAVSPVVEALPSVVCPVILAVVAKKFVVVRPVDEEFPRYVCPEIVSEVADAVVSVVCPVALSTDVKRFVAVTPVVEAFTRLAIVE
jgi:hypothetical protein